MAHRNDPVRLLRTLERVAERRARSYLREMEAAANRAHAMAGQVAIGRGRTAPAVVDSWERQAHAWDDDRARLGGLAAKWTHRAMLLSRAIRQLAPREPSAEYAAGMCTCGHHGGSHDNTRGKCRARVFSEILKHRTTCGCRKFTPAIGSTHAR